MEATPGATRGRLSDPVGRGRRARNCGSCRCRSGCCGGGGGRVGGDQPGKNIFRYNPLFFSREIIFLLLLVPGGEEQLLPLLDPDPDAVLPAVLLLLGGGRLRGGGRGVGGGRLPDPGLLGADPVQDVLLRLGRQSLLRPLLQFLQRGGDVLDQAVLVALEKKKNRLCSKTCGGNKIVEKFKRILLMI